MCPEITVALLEAAQGQRQARSGILGLIGRKLLLTTRVDTRGCPESQPPPACGPRGGGWKKPPWDAMLSPVPLAWARLSTSVTHTGTYGVFVPVHTWPPVSRGNTEIADHKRLPFLAPSLALWAAGFQKPRSPLFISHAGGGLRSLSQELAQSRSAGSWALPSLLPPALFICCLAVGVNNSSGREAPAPPHVSSPLLNGILRGRPS
jgi:hypothetical protein